MHMSHHRHPRASQRSQDGPTAPLRVPRLRHRCRPSAVLSCSARTFCEHQQSPRWTPICHKDSLKQWGFHCQLSEITIHTPGQGEQNCHSMVGSKVEKQLFRRSATQITSNKALSSCTGLLLFMTFPLSFILDQVCPLSSTASLVKFLSSFQGYSTLLLLTATNTSLT